jgi:hypothetical protein
MSLIRVERWEFSTCQEAIEAAEWLEKDAAYLRREAEKYKPGWRAVFMIPRILSNADNSARLAAELRDQVKARAARENPVCDCGAEASWHGSRTGRRVFCCDRCWLTREDLREAREEFNQSETLRDWEDTAKNWEDV